MGEGASKRPEYVERVGLPVLRQPFSMETARAKTGVEMAGAEADG